MIIGYGKGIWIEKVRNIPKFGYLNRFFFRHITNGKCLKGYEKRIREYFTFSFFVSFFYAPASLGEDIFAKKP